MANSFKTRNEKVNFLNGIVTGLRSIAEISKPGVEIWENHEQDDALLTEVITGRIVSKQGFNPNRAEVTIVWADTD